ncbi:MAG: 50S ribosomal protein L32 [Candidatus Paceibacterota bacterium]
MRHTRGHTRNRRSHHALKNAVFAVDPKTGNKHLRHRVDPVTGMYRGRQVLDIVKKVEKKQAKRKAKVSESAK